MRAWRILLFHDSLFNSRKTVNLFKVSVMFKFQELNRLQWQKNH